MRIVLVAALACACGRIDFDPISTSAPSDGSPTGDAHGPGSDATVSADAPVTACTNAIAVTQGSKTTVSTCNGDRIDGCGPAGTQEVVFSFHVPATAGYNFAAYDTGTMNVSSSTGFANATCSAVGMCAGILGTTLTGGQTVYLVVESNTVGCKTIDFTVM